MNKAEAFLELLATGSNLMALSGKQHGFGGMLKQAATIIKEDGPNLFGLGFDDESLWLDALRKVEAEKPGSTAKLTALLRLMNDYEDYFLRMVVTNIKLPSEVVKQGDSTVIKPTTNVKEDPRVQALVFITGLIKDDLSNVEEARQILRDHKLLRTESKFIEIWRKLVAQYEKFCGENGNLLQKLFGVKSWRDLDPNEVALRLQMWIDDKREYAERRNGHKGGLKRIAELLFGPIG